MIDYNLGKQKGNVKKSGWLKIILDLIVLEIGQWPEVAYFKACSRRVKTPKQRIRVFTRIAKYWLVESIQLHLPQILY